VFDRDAPLLFGSVGEFDAFNPDPTAPCIIFHSDTFSNNPGIAAAWLPLFLTGDKHEYRVSVGSANA
jgi:hypothetical protein